MEKRFNVGICACRVKSIRSEEDILGEDPCANPVILEGDDLFHRFFQYEFWGLYGKMYRKEFLIEIPFPSATISEDYYVMTRVLNKVGRMAYTANPLYFYEKHPGSLSRQQISIRSFEEFDNVKAVLDFTSVRMPEFRDYALSNATETAVKLLVASRKQSHTYSQQRKDLKLFLSQNRREILSCGPLNRKVALLALLLEKV